MNVILLVCLGVAALIVIVLACLMGPDLVRYMKMRSM
jgi:hypothetical protein